MVLAHFFLYIFLLSLCFLFPFLFHVVVLLSFFVSCLGYLILYFLRPPLLYFLLPHFFFHIFHLSLCFLFLFILRIVLLLSVCLSMFIFLLPPSLSSLFHPSPFLLSSYSTLLPFSLLSFPLPSFVQQWSSFSCCFSYSILLSFLPFFLP